jgi:hypothetical protein
MDLQVGREPIVGIDAGQRSGMFSSIEGPKREEVDLPVLHLDGLGIISAEWRPGSRGPAAG